MLSSVRLKTARGDERVACELCHSLRPTKPLPKNMEELKEFHLGMQFKHGTLPCTSCHSAGQPPRLHLASGAALEMVDAMQLCAQCHGTQFRDYTHGAHGGMNGHWDTTQGPRLRNHCVDCHDPHRPQIQAVHPAPAPRDRFFGKGLVH
ncbi:MAG: hypothetical protein RJA70_60 [Pseudomonadota bacterium]|jgi:hypothetical protein